MPISKPNPAAPANEQAHKPPVKPARAAGRVKNPTASHATRERILNYLQENRVVSVHTLSRDWGLTRADIRYHLNTLLAEGLIELLPRDPNEPVKRGRPTQQYRLSTASAPDNLPALCSALLDILLGQIDEANETQDILQLAAQRLAGDFSSTGTPTQRFTQAVTYLNQHGYRARWEAYASGPRLLLRACPYAALLAQHPELCTLDLHLLEQLVQRSLAQTARMNFATGRPPTCIFSSEMS